MSGEPPDHSEATPAARQHDRAARVESILDATECLFEREQKYPSSTDELAVEYADQEIDLPNETEALGDVFDRLGEEFDSPLEAREAVLDELTGAAGDEREYNDERDLEAIARDTPAAPGLDEDSGLEEH
ncbi:MAG: hypothetical protein ABEJ42_02140 [Halobacteriaceae archaeon]